MAASPLRVSAGISPDFAGCHCDTGTRTSYAPDARDDSAVRRRPTAPTEDPRPDGLRRAPSLVVVNTGDGKGKSSAAFGVMVRGVARGWKVAVVQFVKSGDWNVGEEKIGRQLGVDWLAVGDGFTWDSDDLEHDKALAATAGSRPRRARSPPASTSS